MTTQANNGEGRLHRTHPATVIASMVVGGYVAMCVAFAAIGLLITHQLGALTRWDDRVVKALVDRRTVGLNAWAGNMTKVADTVGILAVLLVATFVLFVLHRRWDALVLVVALVLELATFLTVNAVVDRPRPADSRLGSLPSTSSFPSGHTAAMVALYGGIALLVDARVRERVVRVGAWVIAVVASTLIGLARVYEGMHHPSDVVAGALLGAAALAVAFVAVRAGRRAAARRQSSEATPRRATLGTGVAA